MLEDLDNESKYLESIDNGEENLEIRLENLKKNDWKRMNSIGENDNRLGLVHMGFECSIHDIYDPEFTDKSDIKSKGTNKENSWNEEMLWENDDNEDIRHKNINKNVERKRRKSEKIKKIKLDSKIKRKWRFSVGDNQEYQRIRDQKEQTNSDLSNLYYDVKSRFSDFYDIEFMEQVWNMREMRGNLGMSSVLPRTPSPTKRGNEFPNGSSNSKLNRSQNLSQTDSLTIKLSCINNPVSEVGSEWNESLMGILDDFSIIKESHPNQSKDFNQKNSRKHHFGNLRLKTEKKSISNKVSDEEGVKKPKVVGNDENQGDFKIKNDQNLNFSNKKRFRKRKGISGTNSLSEMTGLLEDELSNLMPELVENLGLFNTKKQKIKKEEVDNKPEDEEVTPGQELIHLTTQTSKNWDQDTKKVGTSKGKIKKKESMEDLKKKEKIKSGGLKLENISQKIIEVATKKALFQKDPKSDRLSHREMVLSAERGLNFLIENWKELGTLQNPPNTLEKFSARKEPKSNQKSKKKKNLESEKMEIYPKKFKKKLERVSQLNPEKMNPNCFTKKNKEDRIILEKSNKEHSTFQRKFSNKDNIKGKLRKKESQNENDRNKANKPEESPENKSTPQNGKKVQVPLLKYPFSNFYLPNAKKIFAKSSAQFSKTHKQNSGTGTFIPSTPKTISDNFILETNPPKSHRQFSNKKRLRNDALKKKIKMNSKKKNSKELQKILEMKKNLVSGRKVDSKIQDSLRRLKSKKMESKAFQSDRNLSVQKKMPYYVYKSNNRLKELISNTTAKPTSIDPSSRISYKTNTLVRALKTNQSNQSMHSCWSNLIPKLYKSKFPNYENSKTGRSQTPSKFNKNKPTSKNNKVFSSSQKRKAKIVFNSKKIGNKMIKIKGVKRERSKNLSCKKTEKGWLSKNKGGKHKKRNGAEYCYFQKKSKSKGKIGQKKTQFSRSPNSIRQSNFSSIPKNTQGQPLPLQPEESKKNGNKDINKELRIWKLKNEYPGIIKGSTNSYMKSSAKMSKDGLEGSSRKFQRKGKKVYSKTPKNNNYGLDAMKITFEYLSSNKNMEKQEKNQRTGTLMSNTSAGRLFSPNPDLASPKNKDPMVIKKVSHLLFKAGPMKLSKNKLGTKSSKFNKLQINVEAHSKMVKKKVKPASTRITTKTNYFPSKKGGKKKFCEYNGENGQGGRKLKDKMGGKMKKSGLSSGKKMYLSKNENIWMDRNRKEWKGFSTCKNYLGSSRNFFGGSKLFGGRFHKEEKLVAEIVGINKQRHQIEDLEYGLKKSKNFKKGRKLSDSIKKQNLKSSKSKIIRLSKGKKRLTKDQSKKRPNQMCRSNSRNSEILIAQQLKRVDKRVSPKVSPVDRTLEARFLPRRGGQINREQNDNNTTFQQSKPITDRKSES